MKLCHCVTAFGLGNPTGSITFNLRFPGQYYDVGTNQFYNHNRFYNPELGRYMEPDPIGLEGGLNPYAYAGSNPVMNVDPSGLSSNSFQTLPFLWQQNIELFGLKLTNKIQDGLLNFGLMFGSFVAPEARLGNSFSSSVAPKIVDNFRLVDKIPEQFFKPNGGRVAEDFITSHSTKHMYNPTTVSTPNKTQFGQNINVKALREDTIKNYDFWSSNVNTKITKYEKRYDFNISTSSTSTGEMRVFINPSKPTASTQFPFSPRPGR